jgi:ribosomal protein L37AE/L43A
MSLHLTTFGKLPCAQCSAAIIAPVWSEYINGHRARHLWNCEDCGYEFETLVFFPSEQQTEARKPLAA